MTEEVSRPNTEGKIREFVDLLGNRVFYCDKNAEINEQLVDKYINKHRKLIGFYEELEKLYNGQHDIYYQKNKGIGKPDHRIAVNFARYVVDSSAAFFNGKPTKITHPDDEIKEFVQEFRKRNEEEDNDAELSKLTAIYGHAYKLLYQNEEAETCVTYLKPTQGFIVYADDLVKAPMFAVLYNKMTKDELTATVYPQNSTETLIFTKDKTSKRLEPKQGLTVFQKALSYLLGGKEAITNPYGDVPMIEFMENDERQGRIESVWSLINNYNEALSEKANDVSYFADAYLKMIGVDLTDKNVAAFLRDNRVINSADPLNEGETVDINFLDKPSSDATQENLLDRLERLIYQMSMTYNANDESFSNNASGISLEFKMQNPRNLAQAKARKFKKGYAQMYKMIFSLPTNVPAAKAREWFNLEYNFEFNIPRNIKDEAETAQKLEGIVSRETQLGVLSIVPDVTQEMERIKDEETEDRLNPQIDFTEITQTTEEVTEEHE